MVAEYWMHGIVMVLLVLWHCDGTDGNSQANAGTVGKRRGGVGGRGHRQ